MQYRTALALAGLAAASVVFVNVSKAQAPAKAASKSTVSTAAQSNLGQLMKGIYYINSNVIFFAQASDPNKVKSIQEASTATDALQSAYGKWEAVENSAMAIVDGASLLMAPGRKCANGRAVPVQNADWPKFVQGMRDAGIAAYKAAQAKDQDKILDAADLMTVSCANCHDKYREKEKLADRCM